MGMSATPARRSIGLIGLGLAVNAANAYSNGGKVRIPDVLQRLGVASLIVNEPLLNPCKRLIGLPLIQIWYTISFLLAGSSNIFAHPAYPDADPYETSQTRIDRACFGDRIYTPSFDHEGLLGALTTAVNMLVGQSAISANVSASQRLIGSLILIAVGQSLHIFIPKYAPLSKPLWTPSFALVTSGYSLLKLLLVQLITPHLPKPVEDFLGSIGQRSLEMYLLSSLDSKLVCSTVMQGQSGHEPCLE